MTQFWLCFVSLFVAVDAFGLLPLYLHMTSGMSRGQRRRAIVQSVATALAVAFAFLMLGRRFLAWLGVEMADFMIAGGVLLFALSLSDLLGGEKKRRSVEPESVGAVPLGVPLLVGPAVLTALLLLDGQHGRVPTLMAIFLNLLLAGGVLWQADALNRFLGRSGTLTLSKLSGLVLAAIGVMIVRKGVSILWAGTLL